MNKLYVYQNQVNGKVYFGQTNRTLEERAGSNGVQYKNCVRFYRAIQKYGWNSFTSYIIGLCKTVEEMNELEEHAIEKARQELGEENVYNLKSGGLNNIHSDETRRKMKEAKTGEKNPNYGKTMSEEQKLKLSEANTGENHPNYGKTLSDETKKKLSDAKIGKSLSEEHKRKMSEARTGENHPMFGKHHSGETKLKMSEAHIGKTLSEETKLKLSKMRKGKTWSILDGKRVWSE